MARSPPVLVVVFGGSGFMGLELISALLGCPPQQCGIPSIASDPWYAETHAAFIAEARLAGDHHRASINDLPGQFGVVQLNRGSTRWGQSPRSAWSSGGGPVSVRHQWIEVDLDEASPDGIATAVENVARTWWPESIQAHPDSVDDHVRGYDDGCGSIRVVPVAFSLEHAGHAHISIEAMQRLCHAVRGDLARFVLISSDSAYDPRKVRRAMPASALHTAPSATAAAGTAIPRQAPLLQESDELLCDFDGDPRRRYGVCKAAIEHVARLVLEPDRIVTFRLPDVVGPFDNTGRWWATQLWGAAEPRRCYFPYSLANRRVSVVFSRDVVAAVLVVIANAATAREEAAAAAAAAGPSSAGIISGAYHLASPPIPLTELTGAILREGGAGAASVAIVATEAEGAGDGAPPAAGGDDSSSASSSPCTSDDGEDACDFYPSVDVPALCTARAETELFPTWRATSVDNIVAVTGRFFRDVTVAVTAAPVRREKHPLRPEHKRALEKLPRWVRIAGRRQTEQ